MTKRMQTKSSLDMDGSLAAIRLEGDITSTSREAVLGVYELLPIETREILLDFSKVPYLNSSGIALVIELTMEARKADRQMLIFGLTPHFQKVFAMVGLTKYTAIHATESEARKSLSR
jgi:anti-sigma B factor antagonist